jgi:hypothetical protein
VSTAAMTIVTASPVTAIVRLPAALAISGLWRSD